MGRIKLIVFYLFIFPSLSFGLVPENIFQNDIELLELMGKSIKSNIKKYDYQLYGKEKILSDPDKRINKTFIIPPYFLPSVRFWFYIYTRFDSSNVVIHDKEDLSIVYDVFNFSGLNTSDLNKHTKYSLQSRLTSESIKKIKAKMKELGRGKAKDELGQKILRALKDSGQKVPRNKKKRRRFFTNLSKNIRAQTGQKDNIQNGLNNYYPFEATVESYFKGFDLPHELLAISFLESSFNTKAKSKVGATGVWQFMRRVGRYFMKVNKSEDGRLNAMISTIAAFHLLHQNKKILGRWDLAVPAYNSGTRHFVKARRKFKTRKFSLEYFLRNYRHPHIGFASKNFYSEFLALVYSLAYREKYFKIPKVVNKKKVRIYLSKCKIKPINFFKALKKYKDIRSLNSHLKWRKGTYPRGTILISPTVLTKRKYRELSVKEMRRKYPKNWGVYLKGHKCSTRKVSSEQ